MTVTDQKTPNLFEFATGELSQDAFLCWLLSWADKAATTDQALHETGVEFVRSIMKKCGKTDLGQGFTITVNKQYESIDILACIEQGSKKYALVIEDKTGTTMHGNQLERYWETVKNDFPDHEHLLVYLKTGAISRATEAEDAGYQVYSGEELQAVLDKHAHETRSDIFRDFHSYLKTKNDGYRAFREKKVDEWVNEWQAWEGFYGALQKKMNEEKVEWGYVANPSGGELVAWWDWPKDEKESTGKGREKFKECDVYLEIHKKADKNDDAKGRHFLAFKVCGVPEGERREIRDALHNSLMKSSARNDWGDVVGKPDRFGSGNSMVFGETGGGEAGDKQDCWLATNSDGRLDMETTIANLRKAANILSDCVKGTP